MILFFLTFGTSVAIWIGHSKKFLILPIPRINQIFLFAIAEGSLSCNSYILQKAIGRQPTM